MADIKSLLDDIINKTDNSFDDNNKDAMVEKFSPAQFRDKLSMLVLKDIVSAMMHDDVADMDAMVDESIIKHIKQNYNGSGFGYLTSARDKLKSPLVGDIISKIEQKTAEVSDYLTKNKDPEVMNNINTTDILKDVDNYDSLRDKLKSVVSDKVVQDVSKAIKQSDAAPTFDKIDDNIKVVEPEVTAESMILKMSSAIVLEHAIMKTPISAEEGLQIAIVEYCINEMDYLFKQRSKHNIFTKYFSK